MAIIINRLIDCSLHERPRPTTHEERHPLGQVQDTFWMSHTELGISGSLELSWSAASFNPSLGWDAVRWQRNPLSVTPSESESEIVANGKAKLSLSLSVSFIHSFTYHSISKRRSRNIITVNNSTILLPTISHGETLKHLHRWSRIGICVTGSLKSKVVGIHVSLSPAHWTPMYVPASEVCYATVIWFRTCRVGWLFLGEFLNESIE